MELVPMGSASRCVECEFPGLERSNRAARKERSKAGREGELELKTKGKFQPLKARTQARTAKIAFRSEPRSLSAGLAACLHRGDEDDSNASQSGFRFLRVSRTKSGSFKQAAICAASGDQRFPEGE